MFALIVQQPLVGEAATFPERPEPLGQYSPGDQKEIVIVTAKGDLEAAIEEVNEHIQSGQVRKRFSRLYNGFSLELEANEMEKIKQLSQVERVDRLAYYEAKIETSVPFIGGEEARGLLDKKGRRLTGKGIKVAVIDTGIDYRHPDLKKNFHGGYDLIDHDADPMETTAAQGAPTFHGTHVAGIIAANGRMKGVAPDAEIFAYRALGPGGQGTTEQVLEAIEKAVDNGIDIINLSLGNAVNGPDWPTSVALDRAVEEGVVAVTSNGNSGPDMWTVGSPGTSSKAISIGASAPPIRTPYLTVVFSDKREIQLSSVSGTKPWKLNRDFPLIEAGYGMKEDYEEVNAKEGSISQERPLNIYPKGALC